MNDLTDDRLRLVAALPALVCAVLLPGQAPTASCGDVHIANVSPGGTFNNTLMTEFYVGDVDGDGLEDLALGDFGGNLYWRRNVQGSGAFVTGGLLASGYVHAAALADFDGDGTNDLVYQDYYTHAYLRRNLGGGAFGPPELLWSNTDCGELACSDLDGDGDLDLVWWGSGLTFGVCRNLGGGTFAPPQPLGPYASDVVAVDLDADGDQDLVATQALQVKVYRNLTGASWSALPQTVAYGAKSVAAIDLHGDGYPEIVVGEIDGDIVALDNDPAATSGNFANALSVHVDVNNTDRWASVDAVDYDGDGHQDLVVQWTSVNSFYERRYSWIGQQGGQFAAEQALVGYEYGPDHFRTTDMSGDGDVDLVYLRGLTDAQGQYAGGSIRIRQRAYSVAAGPVQGGVSVTSVTGNQPVGAYFDIAVQTPGGANFWGLDTGTTSAAPWTTVDVEVYVTHGSFLGKEGDDEQWVRVGTGSRVFGAGSSSSPAFRRVVLDKPFFLPAGNYGVAVFHRASGFASVSTMACTASAVAGAGQPGEVVIHPNGVGRATSYGTLSSPGIWPLSHQAALWNGRLCYDDGCWGRAASGAFSAGCENTAGAVPVLGAMPTTPVPVMGTLYRLVMQSRMPTYGPGLLHLGFSGQSFNGLALPLDLAAFGAPGCTLATSVEVSIPFVLSPAVTMTDVPIPNIPTLVGAQFFGQLAVVDSAANASGVVYSNGFASRVGY